jgi:transposase
MAAGNPHAGIAVVYRDCAGIDVHKDSVVICVRHRPGDGPDACAVRTYGTTTQALEQAAAWLKSEGVPIAAMESTGVYWQPVWNILEGQLELLLVNAHHYKQVPGHKTDVRDSRWLASLLQHGLLKGSFVPDRELRELRELTRGRATLVQDKARVVNRIQKILEGANIKLASVASDVVGVSARAMLRALIAGEQTPQEMAELAQSRMAGKKELLKEALHGHVTDHHRFLLSMLLDQLEALERQVAAYEARMEVVMNPFMKQAVERLDPIPGINRQGAIAIVSEIGPDMTRFPTGDHLCSWAGMAPGNHQSAGKRKNSRTNPGNRWLKALLDQMAWAASKKKDSFFKARYHRLAPRRGKKRAAMAVGRSILLTVHALLEQRCDFKERGAEFYTQRQGDRVKKHLVHRLEKLGYKVTLQQAA